MSYDFIRRRFDDGDVAIIDGPMGTELQRRGARLTEGAWATVASVERPELVLQVHLDYIEAGADVITTNTAAASRERLAGVKLPGRTRELNEAAVRIAREAASRAPEGKPVAVAGSITTVPESENTMTPSVERAKRAYLEQAEILAESGIDFLLLERLQDVDHSLAALESAASVGLPVWAGFSCRLADDRSTVLLVDDPRPESFGRLLETLPTYGVAAVNIMHTDVTETSIALAEVRHHWLGPLGAYPHDGRFDPRPQWVFTDTLSPEDFLQAARHWQALNVQILGACCGLGVEHIRALARGFSEKLGRRAA